MKSALAAEGSTGSDLSALSNSLSSVTQDGSSSSLHIVRQQRKVQIAEAFSLEDPHSPSDHCRGLPGLH